VEVPVPFSPQQLLQLVEDALKATTFNIRLAIFDHITSNTAALLPVEELVRLCHRTPCERADRAGEAATHPIEGCIPVLIDGAHALGALDLDVPAVGADFYVSNCHKWFLAPKGCAFLWVEPRHKSNIIAPIISHGFGSGFCSQFMWDGCRDYSSALSISTALKFWRGIGANRIRAYCHSLVTEASLFLSREWNTETLFPSDMHVTMAVVRIPDQSWQGMPGDSVDRPDIATSAHAKTVQDRLHYHHKVEVPVKLINGRLWVRISAHIYNCMEDYHQLAKAVETLWQ